MDGKVETTLYDTYLLVHLEGDPLSPEEIGATWRKILEQATESNLDIVILQESPLKLRPSILRLHGLTNFLSVSKFSNRIALVSPRQMHANDLEFFINASKNHGISARSFSSMEDAVTWIAGDKDDS